MCFLVADVLMVLLQLFADDSVSLTGCFFGWKGRIIGILCNFTETQPINFICRFLRVGGGKCFFPLNINNMNEMIVDAVGHFKF